MSTDNAGLAKELGYTNVRVFLAGEPAWSDEGYPVYASNEFVEKGNIVLLDLRQGDAQSKAVFPAPSLSPTSSSRNASTTFPVMPR